MLTEQEAQRRQHHEPLKLDELHDDRRIGAMTAGELLMLVPAPHDGIDHPLKEDNFDEADEGRSQPDDKADGSDGDKPRQRHGAHPNATSTPAVSATQKSDNGKKTFQPSRMSWS